jgi:hypothetical protein
MMEKLVDRLSDAPNVRSLWRALTGVALLLGWGALVVTPLLALWNWSLVPLYWIATAIQVKTLYRTKKLLVTVANHSSMATDPAGIGRSALLELHKELGDYVRGKL